MILKDMVFLWKDYCTDYINEVEALFDSEVIKSTGIDEGFKAFYDYWVAELGGNNFFSKVVFYNDDLIGVIAFAKSQDGTFTIQSIIVVTEYRGKGYGTMILKELLDYSKCIVGQEIFVAKAVVYPENIASQKSFLKAGFQYAGIHPDGDALYYQYDK